MLFNSVQTSFKIQRCNLCDNRTTNQDYVVLKTSYLCIFSIFTVRTVFDAKRLIGRFWSEPTVQIDMELFPLKVSNKNNVPHVEVIYLFKII